MVEPSVFCVGGFQVSVAEPLPVGGGGVVAELTVIVNSGRETAAALPSLTLILMFANVPVALGVPVSLPLVRLNVAHDGLFAIDHESELPSGSLAVGANE